MTTTRSQAFRLEKVPVPVFSRQKLIRYLSRPGSGLLDPNPTPDEAILPGTMGEVQEFSC